MNPCAARSPLVRLLAVAVVITSYWITMAGVVASRLLALAGAGGIAVTAWALRRIGMRGRDITARMAAFFTLLYGRLPSVRGAMSESSVRRLSPRTGAARAPRRGSTLPTAPGRRAGVCGRPPARCL